MIFLRHLYSLLIYRPNWVGFLNYLTAYVPRLFRASAALPEMNQRHLLIEIGWFGLLVGSTMTFQVIFATRLGASPLQVSLITAGPAVMNLLFTLPTGRWLEDKPVISTLFWSVVVYRFSFVLVAFLPLLGSVRAGPTVWLLILITLIGAIPQGAVVISFNNMFAEVVNPERRIGLVSTRNALVALIVTITTLASGQILARIAYPLNYLIVFSVGVLGAIMSSYHLRQIRVPFKPETTPTTPSVPTTDLEPSIRKSFIPQLSLKKLSNLKGRGGTFLFAIGMFHLGQFAITPLLPLYFVRVLNLDDSQIGGLNAAFFLANFIGSLLLMAWLQRAGNRSGLVFGGGALILFPLALITFSSYGALLITHVSIGIAWAAAAVGSQNRILEMSDTQNRATYLAAYNFVLNGGILLGPLLASTVAEFWGVIPALFITSALRATAFLVLLKWG